MNTTEQSIDHEVRIRILEKIAENIDKKFERLESKMDSQFHWILGTVITLFGGIILHLAKLI
jgi:hypothetical protein